MLWRAAYAALLWLALPWLFVRLWWRGHKEPLYRTRVAERFGRYAGPGPVVAGRPVIWLHAVSLGETRAAQPLFQRLREAFPGHDFVVTQMTASGREAAQQLFGSRAKLAWLPYDYGFAVRGFLKRFRPVLGILLETEVWFTLARCCRQAGVPLVLVNARLSEKSARGYEAVGPLARAAFSSLAAVAAQTESDAARLRGLGAGRVEVSGNIKFDVTAAPGSASLAAAFRHAWGERPVFLAASTREGEEELLLDALARHALPALTVIVPRHPQRFGEVAVLLERRGWSYARRSADRPVNAECRFLLGDSLGEMPAYYAAADVAFVGGSLLEYGCQNLIEACAAGIPVLFGPSTYNFAQAADQAVAEGAARRVRDAAELVREAARLLSDAPLRRAMGEAGRTFCARHRGATERVVELVGRLLPGGR
jgi:3-deoxy-D-manno-octulosonic-acid transferase